MILVAKCIHSNCNCGECIFNFVLCMSLTHLLAVGFI